MQSARPEIPVLNMLGKEHFTSAEVLDAATHEPTLTKEYPLGEVRTIAKSMRQRAISIVETTLRELSFKTKFPCLTYSLRQLILLHHLCILNNPNFSPNALQFISHIISKSHLYSIINIQGHRFVQAFDVIIYLNKILSDLIPILLEKSQFALIFETVGSLGDLITNSMSLGLYWMLIESIRGKISPESKGSFVEILNKVIKNKECLNFVNKALVDNKRICLDYLVLLRFHDQKLDKYNLVLENSKLKRQPDLTYPWPPSIKQAYLSSPSRDPFPLTSKHFKQLYDNLLHLQVFCSSPLIESINDYVVGDFDTFLQFIKVERFGKEGYRSKLEKWIGTMKEIERVYVDKRRIKQIKEDIVALSG